MPAEWPGTGANPLDASTTTKGLTKLSTPPNTPSNPIAAGDNDARLSDARTPTAHAGSHRNGGTDALALDQLAAPTGDISLGNHKLTGLSTPTGNTDAVTKAYADG